ncbi:hypothetical protein A8W25_03355 [Streptomyces sp. ERV7]|uniref:hypothetical protein n=1 Tax=Streptomyces sp. ERV7 TaxID=1322334 RepID=UPI0007F33BC4|nr:hypothetical protein A8W25_03355 [Streptomyces sp. ERV7]
MRRPTSARTAYSSGSAAPGERTPGRRTAEELTEAYGKRLDLPCGSLTHLFPEPAALAAHPDPALAGLAAALADGRLRLDAGADREEAVRFLRTLPGLGARAVALIRMRALGEPDVGFGEGPGEDSGGAGGDGELWRPWRSYAHQHLLAADA